MADILVYTILASGVIGWLFMFIKLIIEFKLFGDYLERIGDKETLYKIGLMNNDGKRTIRSVPFTSVHERLIMKYNETKDNQYLIFDDIYMAYGKKSIFIIIALFVMYCIFQIIRS
jgi:hypothetical protein